MARAMASGGGVNIFYSRAHAVGALLIWSPLAGGAMAEGVLSYFDELYMEYQQKKHPEDETKKEAEFIVKALGLKPGDRVLDIGCGYGRHAVVLAEMGLQVVGLDINPAYLEVARAKAKELGVKVDFVPGDMRHMPWRSEFDGAYMFYTSFGFYDDEDNVRVLSEAASALKPGGRLLVDVRNRERLVALAAAHGSERWRWWEGWGDLLVLGEEILDLGVGRITDRRIFFKSREFKGERSISLRLYSLRELISLMKEAGLEVQAAYGDYNASPYSVTSPRMILVGGRVG